MSKDEIKNRFKKTKLGKKIFKRFKLVLIMFIISHVLMLLSLVLFIPKVSKILAGNGGIGIIFGIILLITGFLSFILSILLVYYDGKIVGCIELFDLMLKAQSKKRHIDKEEVDD